MSKIAKRKQFMILTRDGGYAGAVFADRIEEDADKPPRFKWTRLYAGKELIAIADYGVEEYVEGAIINVAAGTTEALKPKDEPNL